MLDEGAVASGRVMRAAPFVLAWIAAASPAGKGPGVSAVNGTVSWSDPRPPVPAPVVRDGHVCGVEGPVWAQHVDVDPRNRIRGALVFVETQTASVAPAARGGPEAREMVIRNCAFEPRVVAVQTDTVVAWKNDDPLLHAVELVGPTGRVIYRATLATRGQRSSGYALRQPGRYRTRSAAGHLGMTADIWVFEHGAFDITDDDGRFEISSPSVGLATLFAWHPDLGELREMVTLGSRKPVTLRF